MTTGNEVTSKPEDGHVLVTVPDSLVGPFQFTLAGPDSEFIHARNKEPGFKWRGRHYPGTIMLQRGTLTVKFGYAWMLKSAQGGDASWRVYKAVSEAVAAIVRGTLDAQPELLEQALHASLVAELERVSAGTRNMEEQLAKAQRYEAELRARLGMTDANLPLACGVCGRPVIRDGYRMLHADYMQRTYQHTAVPNQSLDEAVSTAMEETQDD